MVLSSKQDSYWTAVLDLAALYISRGYPKGIVQKWLSSHAEKCWEIQFQSHSVDTNDREIITLKTHFNEAWNDFSISDLIKAFSKPLHTCHNAWEQQDFGSMECWCTVTTDERVD